MRPNGSWFDEIVPDEIADDEVPWEREDTIFAVVIGGMMVFCLGVGFLLGMWLT